MLEDDKFDAELKALRKRVDGIEAEFALLKSHIDLNRVIFYGLGQGEQYGWVFLDREEIGHWYKLGDAISHVVLKNGRKSMHKYQLPYDSMSAQRYETILTQWVLINAV